MSQTKQYLVVMVSTAYVLVQILKRLILLERYKINGKYNVDVKEWWKNASFISYHNTFKEGGLER